MQTLQKLQEMIECIIWWNYWTPTKLWITHSTTQCFSIYLQTLEEIERVLEIWKVKIQLSIMRKCQLKIFFSQEALAIAFETEETRIGNPDCYFSLLSKQMEQKRNELSTYLNDAGLVPITPGGGYFIVADISSIGMHIWHRQWFWRQMKFWSFQEIQWVLIK